LLSCECLDGFNKIHVFVFHQERYGRAMRTAAKTVIELLIGYDAEGGSFLVMEGTAGFVLMTGFFQRYTSINYVDNISAVEQIVDKPLWDESSHG
jgi:hypothetical protein